MCGFLVTNQKCEGHELFERALKHQNHRGPDSNRIIEDNNFLFGFNRLAIIDPHERSMQPLVYKNIMMVMNGELYNYRQLRNNLSLRGYTFKTSGDAEVYLYYIYEYGIKEALKAARGMYALTVLDRNSKRLVLARDRLGIKPLYYSYINGKIIAASEIKTIKHYKNDLKNSNLDKQVVYNYIKYGAMHETTGTFYGDIKSVPAGSYMSYEETCDGEITNIERYYNLPKLDTQNHENDNFVDTKEELINTMRLHIQSDVPVGLALSGGIDSSILASYYSNKLEFRAYSLRFPDDNPENHLIDKTVDELGLNHKYVDVKGYESIDIILKIIDHIGQPFRASQTIYQYALRDAASKDGIRVFLTGDGADEVFAGYSYSIPYAIADILSKGKRVEAIEMATSMEEFSGQDAETLVKIAEQILKSGNNSGGPLEIDNKLLLYNHSSDTHDSRDKIIGISEFLKFRLMVSPIPYWLAVEDSISMMASVETRVPYLDHELIRTAWKNDKSTFISQGVTKYPLRKSMNEYIPQHVVNAKRKFQRPGRDAYLVYELFKDDIIKLLSNEDSLRILNTKECKKSFINDIKINNQKKAGFWFRILTYMLWMKNL